MSEVGEVLLGVVVGYLIGTFPSADLVTRVGVARIRRHPPAGQRESRAGSTRCGCSGKGWGALVMFLDALKGVARRVRRARDRRRRGVRGGDRRDRRPRVAGVDPVPRRAGRRNRRRVVLLGVPAVLPDRGGLRPRRDPDPAATRGSRSCSSARSGWRRRRCGGRPTCPTGGAPSRQPACSSTRCSVPLMVLARFRSSVRSGSGLEIRASDPSGGSVANRRANEPSCDRADPGRRLQ